MRSLAAYLNVFGFCCVLGMLFSIIFILLNRMYVPGTNFVFWLGYLYANIFNTVNPSNSVTFYTISCGGNMLVFGLLGVLGAKLAWKLEDIDQPE